VFAVVGHRLHLARQPGPRLLLFAKTVDWIFSERIFDRFSLGLPVHFSVPLEILDVALMLFSRSARLEGAEIAPPAGPGIDLAGIEPVFARA
jgi:hypothetical protein